MLTNIIKSNRTIVRTVRFEDLIFQYFDVVSEILY